MGAAGAGKSTLAGRLFDPSEVLSSDDLRAAIRGDPADQSVSRTAFGILHRELGKRLVAGRLVVVDATNLTEAARVALLRRAAAAKVPAIAIVLVPPAAVVHARNAARPGRVVPAEIVDRQLAAAAALGANAHDVAARLRTEGFAAVHVLETPDAIDALTIVRSRRPSHPR